VKKRFFRPLSESNPHFFPQGTGVGEEFITPVGPHRFGRIESDFHGSTKAPGTGAFVPNSIP
jgi:hypothetical protein